MTKFQEARARIAAFRKRSFVEGERSHIHAVLLDLVTDGIIVQVERPERIDEVEGTLRARWHGVRVNEEPADIRFEVSPRASVMGAGGGARIKMSALANPGTVGWSFILNDTPVGITANHVLARDPECPPPAGVCILGSGASAIQVNLHDSTPFRPYPHVNSWDLAIVRYTNLDDIDLVMEHCQGRDDTPYPVALANDLRRDGETFEKCWTVGQTPPHRSEGNLKYVGDVEIIAYARTYRFTSVLVFDQEFAQDGDSGSIAVYASDNEVAGLVFARAPQDNGRSLVYANPLFMTKWAQRDPLETAKGLIPRLSGDSRPPDIDVP